MPLVTLHDTYPPQAQAAIRAVAARAGAVLHEGFTDCYQFAGRAAFLRADYTEVALFSALSGQHQALNLCLAISLLMTQSKLAVSEAAIVAGAKAARWPARMQHLGPGPLTVLAPDQPVWLDGGHNPSAGAAIAAHFDGPLHLVIGMIEGQGPARDHRTAGRAHPHADGCAGARARSSPGPRPSALPHRPPTMSRMRCCACLRMTAPS